MMNQTHVDKEAVKARAAGRWLDILETLAPTLRDAVDNYGSHVDCPFPHHGGKNDFRMPKKGSVITEETGGAICTCGKWSDGFGLLMETNRWDFKTALLAVAREVGFDVEDDGRLRGAIRPLSAEEIAAQQARVEKRRQKQAREDARFRSILKCAWEGAVAVTDQAARPLSLYLANRGLSIRLLQGMPTVRYHPALPLFNKDNECLGEYPALLSVVMDARFNPVTLHRTYLTAEGQKIAGEKAKKLMPVPSNKEGTGNAIVLAQPGEVLGVAEGIETTLSVIHATGMPCWSTVSAPIMEKFEPPARVKKLYVWADRDRSQAGERAAQALQERMLLKGIACEILLPGMAIPPLEKSVDWNDVLKQVGPMGFPHPTALKRAA